MKMAINRKRKRIILSLLTLPMVAVFFLSCIWMLSCGKKYLIVEESILEKGFHYRLKNFERAALDEKNQLQYKIEAADGYSYYNQNVNRFAVYDFVYYQYDDNQQLLYNIRGGRGEFDTRDRWMVIRDGARFEHRNGMIVKSRELRYDLAFGILESNERVEIVEGNIKTICGKGVIIDRNRSYRVCYLPVLSQN